MEASAPALRSVFIFAKAEIPDVILIRTCSIRPVPAQNKGPESGHTFALCASLCAFHASEDKRAGIGPPLQK